MTDMTTTSQSGSNPGEASLATADSPVNAPQNAPGGEASHPRPTFDVLPLSRELRETLNEIGYTNPTPVQIAVWEPATRGKDAVVQARTGTGKTAAFGLPIVDQIVRRSQAQVQAMVLCPTRELAVQVSGELERLSKRRQVKIVPIYGGAPMPRQVEAIAAGAQVIVGTPGRVLDHIRRGTLDPKHIRLLVLDESDEMLSMGFERELTAILESLPKERQTLLFSATIPPDIERMAKSRLRSPEFITLSGDHIGALSIQHFVYMVASDKVSALLRIIEVENPESAVVFCNTKDETERVAQALVRQGYDADWLNGDLPQPDREKVMSATREGRLRFLVATDVAARGIDISHLTHVINFDFPQDAEAYVHRTGRTGRAGRTGTAIALITPHDIGGLYYLRLTYKIRPVEKQIPTEGELKTRAEADLVSLLAEAFIAKGTHPEDLKLARRLLTHDQCDRILAGLLRDHLGARPTAKEEASAARRAPRMIPAPPVARPAPPPPPPRPIAPPQAAAPAPSMPTEAPPSPPQAPRESPPQAPVAIAPPQITTPPAAVAARPFTPPAAPLPPAALPPPAPPPPHGLSRASAPETRDAALPPPAPPPPPASPRARGEGPEPRERGNERRGNERSSGRRRDARGRDEHYTPVSAAQGSREGVPVAPGRNPQRHADFITWQPPEEEGDDEPILGEEARAAGLASVPRRGDRGEMRDRAERGERADMRDRADARDRGGRGEGRNRGGAPSHRALDVEPRRDPAEASPAGFGGAEAPRPVSEANFAEIFVNIGRREGARASDLQRILTEHAGIDKADVRRIRVRDRNAFVSVRRVDLARAIEALNGATFAGKSILAEPARERASEAELEGATPGDLARVATFTVRAEVSEPLVVEAESKARAATAEADVTVTTPLTIEPPTMPRDALARELRSLDEAARENRLRMSPLKSLEEQGPPPEAPAWAGGEPKDAPASASSDEPKTPVAVKRRDDDHAPSSGDEARRDHE